jgi:glycerol uptake facilitator protein
MNAFLAEFIGTAILVILGNGVVANVLLNRTKGNNGGWIVITAGWGLAVFVAILCVDKFSGAHLNPAVTLALATAKKFNEQFHGWRDVPMYIVAQMLGGIVGGTIVYVFYREHYKITDDANAKLGTFATAPNIRSLPASFICELIGTFMLVFPIFCKVDPSMGLGALGALPVGLLVFAIGLSLGGTTGYAINPARDLGPRIAHAFLPIPGKGSSDWQYAWVPVLGPIAGGLLAAGLARLIL